MILEVILFLCFAQVSLAIGGRLLRLLLLLLWWGAVTTVACLRDDGRRVANHRMYANWRKGGSGGGGSRIAGSRTPGCSGGPLRLDISSVFDNLPDEDLGETVDGLDDRIRDGLRQGLIDQLFDPVSDELLYRANWRFNLRI